MSEERPHRRLAAALQPLMNQFLGHIILAGEVEPSSAGGVQLVADICPGGTEIIGGARDGQQHFTTFVIDVLRIFELVAHDDTDVVGIAFTSAPVSDNGRPVLNPCLAIRGTFEGMKTLIRIFVLPKTKQPSFKIDAATGHASLNVAALQQSHEGISSVHVQRKDGTVEDHLLDPDAAPPPVDIDTFGEGLDPIE